MKAFSSAIAPRLLHSHNAVNFFPHIMSTFRLATVTTSEGCINFIDGVQSEALGLGFKSLVTRVPEAKMRRDAWLLVNVPRQHGL